MVELWNPTSAGSWALLFSGAFGAWIQAANWRSLGQDGKATANMAWFWVFLVSVLVAPIVSLSLRVEWLSGVGTTVLLIAWYFSQGKKQQDYVKKQLGGCYRHRPWGKPLMVAVLCMLAYGLSWGAVGIVMSRPQIGKSAAPIVTGILKDHLGSDATCVAVKLGERLPSGVYQATASLDDGSTVEITVEQKGGQIEVVVPQLIQHLVATKKSAIASGNAAKIEQARKMFAAHTRALVKDRLACLKAENPTNDVAAAMESVVGVGGIWRDRAALFHEAGDDGPAEAIDLYNQGGDAEGRGEYPQAIEAYSRAIQKDAGCPWALNNLAWALATSPEKPVQDKTPSGKRSRKGTKTSPASAATCDGPRAVELAKSALDVVGVEYWAFAGTLAAAYARSGDFEKAVQWQEKAIASAPQEEQQEEREILASFTAREAWTDDRTAGGVPGDGLGDIRKLLHSVTIPEVDFRLADVSDIVGFLSHAWREAMPQGNALRFQLGSDDDSRMMNLTMKARDVPFDEVLGALAAAGCQWQAEGDAIVVRIDKGPDSAGEADPAAIAEMRRMLASVIVPEVDFRQADAYDVLAFLGATFRERGPKGKAANFVLARDGSGMDASAALPEITMVGREIPLDKVLDVIAKASGCEWTAEGETVVIRPLGSEQRGAAEVPRPSAEDKELAKAACDLFGEWKDDPRFAGDADLLLVANAIAKMKARTVFPTTKECDAILDACQRLAGRKLAPEVQRAVAGAQVLTKYERDMMAKGYRRYGGVFMDPDAIEAARLAAAEAQRAAKGRKANAQRQTGRSQTEERVLKEFSDSQSAEDYASQMNKRSLKNENRYYVTARRRHWFVCIRDDEVSGATDGGSATDASGMKNFGYVDPYPDIPRSSKTVVASYSSYKTADEARRRRNSGLSGPSDALAEAVINAGDAVAFSPPPPKCDIEYNAETKMWDLFVVRQ